MGPKWHPMIVVNRKADEVVCNLVRIPRIENPVLESIRNGGFQSRVCPEQDLNLHDLAATSS
jgi:hypothetical protein